MNVVIDMMNNKAMHIYNKEKRRRNTAGFTMAELLIVIAIIGVLAGVSFIAVQSHQKSMTQLQYDAIAKEIFVAAQNHLTLAKSENYLNSDTKGNAGNAEADIESGTGDSAVYNKDIYYFTSSDFTATGTSILDQMLPFGSIELISGGNFIIRYQPNAARVLDVFYWTNGSSKYDANLSGSDYPTLVGEKTSESNRHVNYDGVGLLGWFGGEQAVETGAYLKAPLVEVKNEERLLVKVTDTNIKGADDIKALNPMLKLIIEGKSSGAKAVIPLTAMQGNKSAALVKPDTYGTSRLVDVVNDQGSTEVTYTIVLDDITTKGMQFAKLSTIPVTDVLSISFDPTQTEKAFWPGENIKVQAVSYSNLALTNIAYSGEWIVNSLFADVKQETNVTKALINNIRHLENLNEDISEVVYSKEPFASDASVHAVQTTNLVWADSTNTTVPSFTKVIKDVKTKESGTSVSVINIYDKAGKATGNDCFLPVKVTAKPLHYEGQSSVTVQDVERKENHSIKGIVVKNTADVTYPSEIIPVAIDAGGLFSTLTFDTIENLELIDFNINITAGDAGALGGTLTGKSNTSKISNVIAYNTPEFETVVANTDSTKTTVTTGVGNAGGLIGKTAGSGWTIEKSAAALIVKSTGGNAGGLIGMVSASMTVTGCYSGGHTIVTDSGAVEYHKTNFNVTSDATAGVAGGLIGASTGMTVEKSYSTCSVKGVTAGGLIGNPAGGSATACYATGRIYVPTDERGNPVKKNVGAFAGSTTLSANGCYYYEIINELEDNTNGGFIYLSNLANDTSIAQIKALDISAEEYNIFVGTSTTWKGATTYNISLSTYYGGKYNLKTVEQLGALLQAEVKDGDGNVTTPADFVATHYGDWPVPEIFVVNTK